MKAWLKGGLIGAGIGIVYLVINLIGITICDWNPIETSHITGVCLSAGYIFYIPIGLLSMVVYAVLTWGTYNSSLLINILNYILILLIILVLFFTIGSVIGLIVGKIKRGKNEK